MRRSPLVGGITARFIALFAAVALAPLLVYGLISLRTLEEATHRSVSAGNLNVARRAAEHIKLYMLGSMKILQAVAADLQQTGLEPWQQDRILKNYVLAFPEFREVTLFDANGHPVVSSRLGPPRVTIPKRSATSDGAWSLAPVTVDDDLLPTTTAVVRVNQFNRTAAWVVGELNLVELWRMVDRIRVGEQGFALLLASDGCLIAHGSPDQKALIARGDTLLDHPLSRRPLPPGGADQAEYRGRDGNEMLAVVARIDPLGWRVIVEQPTSEAYAVSNRLQRLLGLVMALATAVIVAVGYWWGRSFLRPIFALMRGTRALADGHLDTRVRIERQDEFRELGDAFNSMADRLVELQADVRKQERQAMFGRIAAGLVHDLAHPIQNIGNSCKLILKMSEDAGYRETFKRTVDRELTTIRRTLEDLRNVARPIPLERFPIDVNKAVSDVVDAMRNYAEIAGLTLEAHLAPEPLVIEGDLFALGRVQRNLILNAIQATAPGGLVSVRTARVDGRVTISVADTGCGIAPERLGAIFEDYVTTKRRGLGLGLAISKKIVEQLNGHIAVTSEVGRGTEFRIELPGMARRPMAAAG
ncbi:MAG: sensor histidine kinase [Acidobacteria bacterium]|nr:sensor histidine kinase [Acidobacteriota bacterium]